MKIVYLSDLGEAGSGYLNLSLPILQELAQRGHDIKVLGLKNSGAQHYFDFSILPCNTLTEAMGMLQNLWNMWHFDIFVVALDIPIQQNMMKSFQNKMFPYIGIMPVEADPVCFQFAAAMMQMDKAFIISQFGTDEAVKAGVQNAEHLVIGMDTIAWKMPTEDERKRLRTALGFDDETFVVFTNADNQERKNLDAGLRAFAKLKDKIGNNNCRYAILTRWNNLVGWDLEEMAMRYGIMPNLVRFDRGLPFPDLWAIYAVADAFLLPSKAEGLGLPVLEAFATGVPVVATDCTATAEHIADGRGYPVGYEYTHIDCFGNANRYWINANEASEKLHYLYDMKKLGKYGVGVQQTIKKAREYVEARSWEKCVDQLERCLKSYEQEVQQEPSKS